jgi:hypothetical protein
MDKSKEVSTGLKLVNDRVRFIGTVENNQPISIDYIPPWEIIWVILPLNYFSSALVPVLALQCLLFSAGCIRPSVVLR